VSNNGTMNFDSAFSVSFVGSLKRFARQDFVSMADNSTAMAVCFAVGTNVAGSPTLNFGVIDGKAPCDNFPAKEYQSGIESDFAVQPGCWYEITCTFNRGILKMYVNGTLIEMKRTNVKSVHVCPNAQLIVGGWWEKDPSASLPGMLDEFRLYNRELNEAEITELSRAFLNSTLPLHGDQQGKEHVEYVAPRVQQELEDTKIGTIPQAGVKAN
jgi:Concanavalin A-like lectin/glucanases superfamily